MILIKPSFKIMKILGGDFTETTPLHLIERAGRTCYKSESLFDKNSAKEFVKRILKKGHESVIEHSAITVKFIIDRGVSHELVRHRLCAFSQESTRYCNYKNNMTFIIPPWINLSPGEYLTDYIDTRQIDREASTWFLGLKYAQDTYSTLLSFGWNPQQARSVLPNALKTELVVTANFREWRHIFKLRCAKAAHPQMREIMIPLHKKCMEIIPVVFDDIDY